MRTRLALCVLAMLLLTAGPAPAHDRELTVQPVKEDPKDAKPPTPPAGMVYVAGGNDVRIGTPRAELEAELAGRPGLVKDKFWYECPRHTVKLRPYFIGKYEVTNAQYALFLADHKVTYDTSVGGLANLDEIAAHLTRMSADMRKGRAQRAWEQLYFANKAAIWKAFGPRLEALLVRRGNGAIDEEATAQHFRYEPLPRGIVLVFRRYLPPRNWPDDRPARGQEDHPVRFVSYQDAERFAEWAGMRLPSEQEWEWAARGPKGHRFPWGNEWSWTAERANWGGKITDAHHEPMTLAVDTLPAGRSGSGCHHMCGNVAEWTASTFQPYPASESANRFIGWVKIIRGGTAIDGDTLVLRSACRNWVGGGPNARPFPDSVYPWVGFRLAAYADAGRDALGPIVRRAVRANRVKAGRIDIERFAGASTRDWLAPGGAAVRHVYALGRAHAIAVVPLERLLSEHGMELMEAAYKRPDPYRKLSMLLRRTRTEHPEWVLGVVHTDLPLASVHVRAKAALPERRRGRTRAPQTEPGTCAPGTYLLGLWWDRLALLDSSQDFVCFLEAPPITMEKRAAGVSVPARLQVDPAKDRATFAFDLPIGGRGRSDELRLHVSAALVFPAGELEAAGTWRHSKP